MSEPSLLPALYRALTMRERRRRQPAAAMARPPRWVEQLAQAFGDPGHDVVRPDGATAPEGFLAALTPLLAAARARLRHELATLAARYPQHPASDPHTLEAILYGNVRRTLERVLAPTLVLELNVARLQGKLPGSSPEERFTAYVARLQQPEHVRPLVAEYPVLFRLAHVRIESWINTSLELIERLYADWEAICATFFPGQAPGRLARIDGAQRSTKRGGRAVAILTFTSGLKVVYKPRPLALEKHFQEVLVWLNACGYQPAFRTLTLLDQETHGWVEWIDAGECTAEAGVWRFYQRQGAYLALLYALEATDFHMSNVIAAGEHPMLIDLEALFHPRDAEPAWPELDLALDRATYHSVLRLGLLPEPELARDETVGAFDQSGLAGIGGQQTPYTLPTWENKGTDTMRLVRKRKRIRSGKNLPALHGRPVNVVDYQEAIDDGFTSLYRCLMERRSELLAPQTGILARFAGDEVRVLPRSGRHYSQLLEQSFHPDLMRDALDRDRFLDRLRERLASEPYLAVLIPHEQADLLAGDVPLFTTRAGSRAVYNSAGEWVADDFFPCSGLEAARQRIASLDERDLVQQRWFIKAALAQAADTATTPTYTFPVPVAAPANLQQQLLNEARAVGERLAQLALRVEGEASWIGVALINGRHWFVEPLADDLYNGLPGVALFLAYLGAISREEQWTALAQAAAATLRRFLVEEREGGADALAPIGAFDGLGGQLYALAHLAALWPDSDLADVVQAQVEASAVCLQKPADDEKPGLARGIGGCLAGLLAAYRVAPALPTLEVARLAGDQLLGLIQAMPPEGEDDPAGSPDPFVHFWCGQAGVAWPLLALAEVSGEERYRQAAATILATIPLPAAAAPGHWLATLWAWPWLDDLGLQSTLSAGLKTALLPLFERNLGRNHSLGRGDLGYLDLLLQAGIVLNDTDLRHDCDRYAAAVVAHGQRQGWLSAVPLGVETPGLMAGLAGIGYGLLRLAAPERVPSILALELPDWGLEIGDLQSPISNPQSLN